jgi:hypothetical protein
MRSSQKVSTLYVLKLTEEQYIIHKCIISQYNSPDFQYCWCSTAKMYICHWKNVFIQLASNMCTTSISSYSLTKQWPLKASLRSPYRWKYNDARSGLYGGYYKMSDHSFWSVWTVWVAVWGQAFSCSSTYPLSDALSFYSESSASAYHAASHCNVYCLLSHPFPNNARGLVSLNPKTQLFLLFVEISIFFMGMMGFSIPHSLTQCNGSMFCHQHQFSLKRYDNSGSKECYICLIGCVCAASWVVLEPIFAQTVQKWGLWWMIS